MFLFRFPAEVAPKDGYTQPVRCDGIRSIVDSCSAEIESRGRLSVMIRLFGALALVAISWSPAAWSEDVKDHTNEGVWLPSSAELGGNPFPDEVRKDHQTRDQRRPVHRDRREIDRSGNLQAESIREAEGDGHHRTEGPNVGKTILAIYERNGDALRVCYDLTGQSRPTEFKTSRGLNCSWSSTSCGSEFGTVPSACTLLPGVPRCLADRGQSE